MKHVICTVTNDLGHDQRMQRICGSLAEAGYRVTLVGRLRPGSPELSVFPFATHRIRCRYDSGKLFYLEYNARLLDYLLRTPHDAVNAVDLDTLLPAYLACRKRGVPCVYDAHELFTETPEVARRPQIKRVWAALARRIISHLHLAYTVGPALADWFSREYGIPFGVVRNMPIATALPPPVTSAGGPRTIHYQGMLNEGRGLEPLLRALLLLPGSYRLRLVGDGDLREDLELLAEELGISSRVDFLGYRPPTELPALASTAWLGVNLLESRSKSYYFSLANKAFDYVQAGLPSLQMNFPEYRALAAEFPVYVFVDRLEPATIAAAILDLGGEEKRYHQLRKACREAAAVWTWDREEKELLRLWKKVVPVGR